MRQTRLPLVLAAGLLWFASPALAGTPSPWSPWNPWMNTWACGAFEYAKRCNAAWHPRSLHCQCLGGGYMGWRLEEYYGPNARNLAPRNGGP
jgi:hypothetical protein